MLPEWIGYACIVISTEHAVDEKSFTIIFKVNGDSFKPAQNAHGILTTIVSHAVRMFFV